MTEFVPYEPPQLQLADTMLAYRDLQRASTWGVRIDADPLGPVNRIVTLMRGTTRVASILCPVPAGATVRLVRDEGAWNIDALFALRDANWRTGDKPDIDIRPPGWRVEIAGRTVLAVTDAEMHTPTPAPHVPWYLRAHRAMRRALIAQARTDADAIANRLGYHRDDTCGGDW